MIEWKKRWSFLMVLAVLIAIFIAIMFMLVNAERRSKNVLALKDLEQRLTLICTQSHSIIQKNNSASNATLKLDGKEITMKYGYPTPDETGIRLLVDVDSLGFVAGINGVFYKKGTRDPKHCCVSYNNLGNGIPKIAINSDGC